MLQLLSAPLQDGVGFLQRSVALGGADEACLERVARLVSAHCLVGWDTDGVPWSEVS